MDDRDPLKRIPAIQIMRGVAALLVVAVHAINLAKFRHVRHGDPLGLLSNGRFYSDFGASGVDLFFVISGFAMSMVLMNPNAMSRTRFIRDRIVRILPLYWLLTLAFADERAFLGSTMPVDSALISVTIWPLHDIAVFPRPVLFVGWTLAFELAFYTALLPALSVPRGRRLLVAGCTVTTLALTGAVLRPSLDLLALFFNPIWLEFLLGILICKLWLGSRRLPGQGIALVVGLALLGAGFLVHVIADVRHSAIFDDGAGLGRSLAWGVPWALVVYGLLSCERRGGIAARSLGALGDASYSLYLVHMLLFLPLEYLLPRGWLPPDLVTLSAIGIAVLAGFACHIGLERPLLHKLRARWRGSGASSAAQGLATGL